MSRRTNHFQTIRSEGGLLPPDLLRRVLDPKEKLEGTRPEDYGLPQSVRPNEVITQSWNRLRKHWAEFRAAASSLPEGEAGTGLTNDKWSLPLLRELGFGLLPTSTSPAVSGRTYAINRFFGPVPVHLVGCGLSLDRRAAGVRGAAAANPHGLVQEFINRSPDHVWAIVANGLRFRVLRDNQALSRQSFLEFDLEAMFTGEVYSDFVLLWLVAHATRFAPREADRPETGWLEQWTKLADEQGTRALGDLRIGVEKALQILGEGFTGHSKNMALREVLRKGEVSLADFHGQLLRVVYRLIFLFVAEDRTLDGQSLLHPRDDSDAARLARKRYAANYSTSRLRELASHIKGSRHGDLWQQFQLLVAALSGDTSSAIPREQLALPALGSFLWNPTSTAALNDAELTNYDFLEALRHLAFNRQGKVLRPVDYRNLGSEELGGVYESLLALTPQISADGARFTFAEFAGSERKTSGSYYTPDSLVQCLLDSALDRVVEETVKGKTGGDAEKAILALKICDPAVGSGHFLVGAAHRLARHLARVRALAAGESEASPLLYQHALRDVIGRCLYAVDMNPMAAELCRVSLWLEALEPGKPLSFLDHHIRIGNSLLGTTQELIVSGIPDDAFTPIEGDDKRICSALKRRNKQEREGQQDMVHVMVAEQRAEYNSIAARTRGIDEAAGDTIDEINSKAEQFRKLVVSQEYQHVQLVADTWCAAFVWKKQANAPTDAVTTHAIRRLEADPKALTPDQRAEVERLSHEYQFFHWHLAFPEVFASGGFDCVLGNPPWERVKLQEKEWFAERSPEIANAPNAAARKRMIDTLKASDPGLYQRFLSDSRKAEGESHLMRNSGRYPLCGRGDINVYTVFAEGMRNLLNDRGRTGCVLPTGIATDDTTKFFFQDVVEKKSLASLFDFENRLGLFPAIDSRMRFCLFTAGRGLRPTAESAEFVFFAQAVDDLRDSGRRFTLTTEDIALLNPNTRTCPIFRSKRDASFCLSLYRRHEIVLHEGSNSPGSHQIRVTRMFDMNKQRDLFTTADELHAAGLNSANGYFQGAGNRYVRLFEGKTFTSYDHRFAVPGVHPEGRIRTGTAAELTEDQHKNPNFLVQTFLYLDERKLDEWAEGRLTRRYLLAFMDVTSATNHRTAICTVLPDVSTDYSVRVVMPARQDAFHVACLCGLFNSFPFDYLSRQKLQGLHLSDYITYQLAVPNKGALLSSSGFIVPRVVELTFTAWDLQPFAGDCGFDGPPFRWDEERRFLLRCELDAAFFHLYLQAEKNGDWRPAEGETAEDLARVKQSFPTPRDAVAYIMDTFPIVKRNDEEKWGEFRTKRIILEIYDALQVSIRTGKPYQTHLDPPPADPRCCHPPRPAEAAVAAASTAQSLELAAAVGRQEVGISPTDRQVLVLCRVVHMHRGTRHERTLGSVKAEKISHIVESHLEIDFGREPKRLAAGPADFPHLKKVVHRAKRGFFAFRTKEHQGGEGATFVTMNGFDKALHRYREVFGEQAAQIDRIIEFFLPMDTEQAEIVATLYAVWNDQLAGGATPTDDAIVDWFYAWDSSKRRIARGRLLFALGWMRENGLLPTGRGKRTGPG